MRPIKEIPQEVREAILILAIYKPDGFERSDVEAACGIKAQRAYQCMARMRDDGWISCTWVGQGSKWTTVSRVDALRDKLRAEYAQKAREYRKRVNAAYRLRGTMPEPVAADYRPRGPVSVFDIGRMA